MFDFLKKKEENKARYMHVAIDTKGVEKWCEENKVSLEDGYVKAFSRVKELMEGQVEQKIPILSFLVLPWSLEKRKELLKRFKELIEGDFFREHVAKNKVKVTLLGKWYDLPSEILELVKKLGEETKDYDAFFLNFCLNYDGQEELVDAFKIMGRQLLAGKLSAENINKETIKENIYSSYFVPPDLMIKNSDSTMDAFFLWDCVGARRVFTGKDFPELEKSDFERVLKE